MFTGGMSQGIINGLEATQVSADRAEMIRSRKLDNEKKEAEELQEAIEKANLASADNKDRLADLKKNQMQGTPLPVPGQQAQSAPQPPMPGQASVSNQPPPSMMQPQNAAQFMGNGGMPPPQGMPPQMQQRPPMPPQMPPQQIQQPMPPQRPTPYVDPTKMSGPPPAPQQQAPQQPPPMSHGDMPQQQNPNSFTIAGMTLETPVAKSTVMSDIQKFKANGYTPDEIRAVLKRDKSYYEAIGNAEKESNKVAQETFRDKMLALTGAHNMGVQDVKLDQFGRKLDIESDAEKGKNQRAREKAASGEGSPIDENGMKSYVARRIEGEPMSQITRGMGKNATSLAAKIDNKATAQLIMDRGIDAAEAGRILAHATQVYKSEGGALNQVTKDVTAIEPFQRMLDINIDKLTNLADKVIMSDSKFANKSINWLKENSGDNPDTQKYLAQMLFVQTEAGRVLNNPRLVGQLSDNARHEMERVVSGDMPLNSTKGVMQLIQSDAKTRVSEMKKEQGSLEHKKESKVMSLDEYLTSKGH